ncbi:hypothetical protein, partial [Cronobacter sakazakii]
FIALLLVLALLVGGGLHRRVR